MAVCAAAGDIGIGLASFRMIQGLAAGRAGFRPHRCCIHSISGDYVAHATLSPQSSICAHRLPLLAEAHIRVSGRASTATQAADR